MADAVDQRQHSGIGLKALRPEPGQPCPLQGDAESRLDLCTHLVELIAAAVAVLVEA